MQPIHYDSVHSFEKISGSSRAECKDYVLHTTKLCRLYLPGSACMYFCAPLVEILRNNDRMRKEMVLCSNSCDIELKKVSKIWQCHKRGYVF